MLHCRIQITVVDGTGRRFPLRGMEGQTLVELLEEQQTPLDVAECERCISQGHVEPASHVRTCCSIGARRRMIPDETDITLASLQT